MTELNLRPDSINQHTKINKRGNTRIWIVFAAIGAIAAVFVVVVIVRFYSAYPYQQLKGFRVPSGSMCPTICPNERIMAAMDAYATRDPQRGELIMMNFHSTGTTYIKRVAAIQGDTIAQGPGDSILVNGEKVKWPTLCGMPRPNATATSSIKFDPVTVPAGSFFVLGDNLENSFDSRMQEFGFVTQNQVIGKPLVIYWSPSFSRIGCDIQ